MIAGNNDQFHIPDSAVAPKEGPVKWVNADERRVDRRADIPALYKTTHERLACDLAMRMESPEEIFTRYGHTPESAAELMESPAFTALLSRIGAEIRENGLSFRAKAKAISEELLADAFDMATDPLMPAAVRADLIKWSAKVAGNEPAPVKSDVPGAGGFALSITFAGQAPQTVVAHQPATIEHQP